MVEGLLHHADGICLNLNLGIWYASLHDLKVTSKPQHSASPPPFGSLHFRYCILIGDVILFHFEPS